MSILHSSLYPYCYFRLSGHSAISYVPLNEGVVPYIGNTPTAGHHEYVHEKPREKLSGLSSLVRSIMAWACPMPVIVHTSYGRCRAVAGEGY
ncbi:hypothetical protein AVEN_81585-1 [Araneus ventricosus]|uniref:Uncharacterized protein n=1 Tax=Araneus ventricosus TaxID=182803 RepID=A0A4Y2FMR0_ARAVE|nr:hypothetical protein AVEN_81585-1 [Araneus ventricosus]